ncbi:hypothetical protein MAPG_02945 [Magnaporthiopsis poae ATCC 64411]|uniref:Cyanovirin-N domain-containing protein n=1 Tax=Magnaporthiopsis poae (strain ATCC 64411 / 73-15) TaxID=644358 RepID=A0A0C4DSQ7_MAGP6|nr:hypothetical protein MAPG_02945 [Magnaporthiopsis poae ATCC 64411]
MKLTIISLAVLTIASGTTALAIQKPPLEDGGYNNGSCVMQGLSSWRYRGTPEQNKYFDDALESIWCNPPGMTQLAGPGSSLKLSNCLANVNGKLTWQSHGGAMQSCTACRHAELLSPYIACTCNDGFGNWIDSGFIDLNEHIYVDRDGALACFGIRGRITTPAY